MEKKAFIKIAPGIWDIAKYATYVSEMKGEKDKAEDPRNQEEQQGQLSGFFLQVTSDSATVFTREPRPRLLKMGTFSPKQQGTEAELELARPARGLVGLLHF